MRRCSAYWPWKASRWIPGFRQHADRVQPGFGQGRPVRDRVVRRAQAECMAAVGVDVHFGRRLGRLQSQEVGQRIAHVVHRVILRLDDQGRRRARIRRLHPHQAEVVVMPRPHMAGIERHGEVRPEILAVGRVDGRVGALAMGADIGDQMAARREAEHADLARIDMQGLGPIAQDRQRALGVLQRHRHRRLFLAPAFVVPVRPAVGHSVFQHDAGHALGRRPIADLGAFQVDGQDLIAATRENHDGGARIASLGRIDRIGRARDIADRRGAPGSVLAGAVFDGLIAGDVGPGDPRAVRPDRHLFYARRRLPGRGAGRSAPQRGGTDH